MSAPSHTQATAPVAAVHTEHHDPDSDFALALALADEDADDLGPAFTAGGGGARGGHHNHKAVRTVHSATRAINEALSARKQPERKLYSRIYGDGGRIEPLLQKEGYKKGPPVGARLQRVIAWQNKKAKTGNQAFIVPHIDDASYVVDQGDFLVVGNINEPMPKKGGVKLVGQSGLSDWVFLRCGCGCNKESDGSLVDVYVDNASTTQRWCQQCVDEKALRCDYNGVYFAKAAGVEMHDGTIWWGRRFKEGGFTCAKSNLRYDNKHRMTFRDSDKSPAVYVSKQWFKDNGIKCKTCGVNTNKAGCSDACKERHVSTKKAREKMEQDVYGAASQTYNWTTASNAMGGTVYTGAGGGGNGGAGGGTVDWGQATAPTIRRR